MGTGSPELTESCLAMLVELFLLATEEDMVVVGLGCFAQRSHVQEIINTTRATKKDMGRFKGH